MSDVSPSVLFEHPLNEKMRTWLRMEFLLQQLHGQRALSETAIALTFFRTIADLLDVLERGEVAISGRAEDMRHDPAVRRAYLGN